MIDNEDRTSPSATQNRSPALQPQLVQRAALFFLFVFALLGVLAIWNYWHDLCQKPDFSPILLWNLFYITVFQALLISVCFLLFASKKISTLFSGCIKFIKKDFLTCFLSIVLLFIVLFGFTWTFIPIIESSTLLLFWFCQLGLLLSTGFVVYNPVPLRLQVHLSVFIIMGGVVTAEVLLLSLHYIVPARVDYGDIYKRLPGRVYDFRAGGFFLPDIDTMIAGDGPGGQVRFVTNSKGFRNDREFDLIAEQDTYRVVFAGDSFVGGYRVDQEETAGRIIEKGLQNSFNKSELKTAGEVLISAIGNPGVGWLWLTEEGINYNPNLVIFGITIGNDPAQTYVTIDPLGPFIVNRELAETNAYIITRGTNQQRVDPKINNALLPPEAFVSRHDPYHKLRRIKALWSRTQLNSILMTATGGALGWPAPIDNFQDRFGQVHIFEIMHGLGFFYVPPTGEETKEFSETFERLDVVLQGLKYLAEENDTELLIVIFPQRYQVNDTDWEITSGYYGLNPERFDLELPDKRILAACEKFKLDCLDLLPYFRAADKQESELYLPRGDMHWNSAGQQLAGEVITKFVLSELIEEASIKPDIQVEK